MVFKNMEQEAGKKNNYTGWLNQDLKKLCAFATYNTVKFNKNEFNKNMNKNELHM